MNAGDGELQGVVQELQFARTAAFTAALQVFLLAFGTFLQSKACV